MMLIQGEEDDVSTLQVVDYLKLSHCYLHCPEKRKL